MFQGCLCKRLLESSLETNVWTSTQVIDRSNVLALALTQLLSFCQTFSCKQYCITFVMTNGKIEHILDPSWISYSYTVHRADSASDEISPNKDKK